MAFERASLDVTNIVPGFSPGLPPPIDAADLLVAAPRARAALLDLRQASEDGRNLLRPLIEDAEDLRVERHGLEARRKQLTTPKAAGGFGLDDDHTSVTDVLGKIARINDEMQRKSALIEARRAQSASAARAVTVADEWLRHGRPGGTAIVDAAEVDLRDCVRKGENAMAAIERHRHRLRELDADQHRTKSAQQTKAEAIQQMRGEVDELAARGEIDVGPLVEAGLPLAWPLAMQRLNLAAVAGSDGARVVGHAMGDMVDVQAMTAWLLHDILIARLEAEIGAIANDKDALSKQAHAERLAELAQERLTIERHEVALIRKARADGMLVEYRGDTDARALLGVELRAVTSSDNAPFGLAAQAMQHVRQVR